MKKTAGRTTISVLLLALSLFLTGCLQETYSREEPPRNNGTQREESESTGEDTGSRTAEEKRLANERAAEERLRREEQRKAELGPFYVPLPPEKAENPRVKAKGIYLSGHTVANENKFAELLDLVATTELNAMVIDAKNDDGLTTYHSGIAMVGEVNAGRAAPIKNIRQMVDRLKEKNVYPIARIVVFRDPNLAEKKPEWAIQKKGGGVWRDMNGFAWVNPYEQNVWDYNLAIAKEAALNGFREIQFDYVRFPENARRVDREANFPGAEGLSKDEAIRRFLVYAREKLADYNVHISADVFGVICTAWGDAEGIGQNWEKVSPVVDIICPMIYPSHYGPGYFGFAVPDANPGGTVKRALTDAVKRNVPLEKPAVLRPWLQSFTATWVDGYVPYGPKEVREQIHAAKELGVDEYLIWNAANRYHRSAFLTKTEAERQERELAAERAGKGLDVLGRTAERALEEYLTAVKKKHWREIYTWHWTGSAANHEEMKAWPGKWTASLTAYKAAASEQSDSNAFFTVDLAMVTDGKPVLLEGEIFEVTQLNGCWRVTPSEEFLLMLTAE